MNLFILIGSICFVLLPHSHARGVPFYELDDGIFPEISNILKDSFFRKVKPEIGHPREVRGWGPKIPLGQVTGVSVDLKGNPVIIHRASRDWTAESFNSTEQFQDNIPLRENIVLTLDRQTGAVLHSWGGGQFYLPHGITIDNDGNTWITDVGLHQVLKFPVNSETPSLILGEKFQPGNDYKHFCKPTAVAVASSGEFFVADGYCNGRILKFSPDGSMKGHFGHLGNDGDFAALMVPHGIALREDVLCIADRDHTRTICIRAGLTAPHEFGEELNQIVQPYNFRVFGIAFMGKDMFGIARSTTEELSLGVTTDVQQEEVIDMWAPLQMFNNPHGIAADEKRSAIYVTEIGPNRIWKFTVDGENEDFN